MADGLQGGHWKGLVVTRTESLVVHMELEVSGAQISGRFEVEWLTGPFSKGTFTGAVEGDRLRLADSHGGLLNAHLEGGSFFFGSFDTPRSGGRGTVTMFHQIRETPTSGIYSSVNL